jgi:hypothetical protein
MQLEKLLSNDTAKGFALGVGAVILVPLIATTLAPMLKPALRSAAKAGLKAYEKARETVDEVNEVVEDLVAEAQAELREERVAAAEGAQPAAPADEAFAEGPQDAGDMRGDDTVTH